MGRITFLGVVLFFVLGRYLHAKSVACESASQCKAVLKLKNGNSFHYYRTFPLEISTTQVTRAIITIHGVNRNANEYFSGMVKAAKLENELEKTLVFSPHFKNEEDSLGQEDIYWDGGSWKSGGQSINSGVPTSSFAVMDEILAMITSGNFPSLQTILIVGHSAGGQFMSRYSAGSPFDWPKGTLKYIISNPSSYFYFHDSRAANQTATVFEKPSGACPEYNDYPYGMVGRNSYMSKLSESKLIAQFESRKIILLIGQMDTLTELLDQSCEAMLQGKNRHHRGLTYSAYLENLFPSMTAPLVLVPGVGHDHELMYQSEEGRSVFFH